MHWNSVRTLADRKLYWQREGPERSCGCFRDALDCDSGAQLLCVTCLVSKGVFARIKVLIWDRVGYRAWGLLHLTLVTGVPREQGSTWVMIVSRTPSSSGCAGSAGHVEASARWSLCSLLHTKACPSWGYRPAVAALGLGLFQICQLVFGIICLWHFRLMLHFFSCMVWSLHGLLFVLEGVLCSPSGTGGIFTF